MKVALIRKFMIFALVGFVQIGFAMEVAEETKAPSIDNLKKEILKSEPLSSLLRQLANNKKLDLSNFDPSILEQPLRGVLLRIDILLRGRASISIANQNILLELRHFFQSTQNVLSAENKLKNLTALKAEYQKLTKFKKFKDFFKFLGEKISGVKEPKSKLGQLRSSSDVLKTKEREKNKAEKAFTDFKKSVFRDNSDDRFQSSLETGIFRRLLNEIGVIERRVTFA